MKEKFCSGLAAQEHQCGVSRLEHGGWNAGSSNGYSPLRTPTACQSGWRCEFCLVPPEWSDLAQLVRARVMRPLLAYRGLGNSVVVKKGDNLGAVRLPHRNEIAARRVYQLYIPGLADIAANALSIEQNWRFDPNAASQGWLYL